MLISFNYMNILYSIIEMKLRLYIGILFIQYFYDI